MPMGEVKVMSVNQATRREVEQLYVRLYPHVSHEYATADSEDCKPDCNGCALLFILEQVEEEVLVIAQARDAARAALTFYADADYDLRVADDGDGHVDEWGAEEILADKGARARAALGRK